MRDFLLPLLLLPCIIFTSVLATPASDAAGLATMAQHNANIIYASLNGTAMLNTSAMVTQMANGIAGANGRLPKTTSNATVAIDTAYLNYLDILGDMADATQRRGRLFHSEPNLPVYNALQTLSSNMHTYGTNLRSKSLIGESSVIRTMTAGSDIINAQAAWVQNANYPGRRRRLSERQRDQARP